MVRTLLAPLVLGLVMQLAGCSGPEEGPEVVVYVSADEYVARPILDRFERDTGIRVRALYDTEATKTTGLVSRIRAERNRPQADLFWSSECFRMIELQQDGLLGRFPPASLERMNRTVPDAWCSSTGSWVAFAPRARVLVYAPDRLDPRELPGGWEALADPEWAGRVAMADPRFGTTAGHFGAMHVAWGEDRFTDWIAGLARNRTAVLRSGNAGVVEGVASGEYDLGMTDTDDVWAARSRGLGVDLVYLRHEADPVPRAGTLLIPNTVGLVSGGANPESARILAEWLASADVERLLMESPSRNIPLRLDPGELAVEDPLQVDLEAAATRLGPALDLAANGGLVGSG
ncbi:MAG: ABC transporter substrate-binding protein [Planctomycetota bacterium]|nr:ABC transporter substrate-binding protein [Planctomycetota bacterium]MEC9234392.1 ABC transporter substrate-binding protein [Planctomycetota bacterium]MED5508556.1 ABC transporter substrate-binding protein [Planctomycetota bacterium]